jgi:hypothetical protein
MDLEETEARDDCAGEDQEVKELPSWVDKWVSRRPAKIGAVEHGNRGTYSVASRYKPVQSEDIEDVLHAVVNCEVREFAVAP